jgi:hypothetical protein
MNAAPHDPANALAQRIHLEGVATQTADHPSIVRMAALRQVRRAWIAATVQGGLMLVAMIAVFAGARDPRLADVDAWLLVDVALVLGLGFGVSRRSRACAVALLVYYVGSKIAAAVEGGAGAVGLLSLLFGYLHWCGVAGTFTLARCRAQDLSTAA